jgi:hypothetical protein
MLLREALHEFPQQLGCVSVLCQTSSLKCISKLPVNPDAYANGLGSHPAMVAGGYTNVYPFNTVIISSFSAASMSGKGDLNATLDALMKPPPDSTLGDLPYNFFYSFSRFEFALKECGYLKSRRIGVSAEPGWEEFTKRWSNTYRLSHAAGTLIHLGPEQQVVGKGDVLKWVSVRIDGCASDLERVVRLLKTVRNNLFHGGKHGGAGWDDPERTGSLLQCGMTVLDEMADLAGLAADYRREY